MGEFKQGGADRGGIQAEEGSKQGKVSLRGVSKKGRGPRRGVLQAVAGKGSRHGRDPGRGEIQTGEAFQAGFGPAR